MRIDAEGWIEGVLQVPSANRDRRPEGCSIDLVVIHAISLPPDRFGGPSISALFTNALDPSLDPYFGSIAGLRVSSHVLIRRDGTLVQYVPFLDRAWHAGESRWRDRSRCNDFSVGIELEGCDALAFEDAQYATLGVLLRSLREQLGLTETAGHNEIAPGRKTDPGPCFDWMRLA